MIYLRLTKEGKEKGISQPSGGSKGRGPTKDAANLGSRKIGGLAENAQDNIDLTIETAVVPETSRTKGI